MNRPDPRFLALLRGVNVGGRALLPMPALRAALSDSGFEDVRTHLQSGNVILAGGSRGQKLSPALVEALIEEHFDLKVRVVLRTQAELADIVARNPLMAAAGKASNLHVVFLGSLPDPTLVDGLDPDRSPPDRFVVSGQEIFLHYPLGSGRSKLNLDYFEKKLGVIGTARNWNTVTRLLQLLGE